MVRPPSPPLVAEHRASRAARSSAAAALAALIAVAASAQDVDGDGASWWSYRPLERPAVPAAEDAAFVRNDVDRFVLAALRQHGLEPSHPADPATLIRRLTYDLTGLPPSPDEVRAFVTDPSDEAYGRLVDRLLASPQYGVKWGRHWLDLVRYAETNSFERDGRKPAVWRYRDWVVDALNDDVPWQRFLLLQLAGDEVPDATTSTIVATGYHRLGLWDDEPTDALQAVYDDLDSIADTTARSMLGISMGCARCHDHKKDPISTRDYYAFLAFFENLAPYRPLRGTGGALSPENYVRQLPEDGADAAYEQQTEAWQQRRATCVAAIEAASTADYALALPSDRVAMVTAESRALRARYRGDHTAVDRLIDDVGSCDAAVQGQIVPIPGWSGTAMRFDGDDRAVLPFVPPDSFTITLRVRSTQRGRGTVDDTRWFTGDGLVDGEVPGVVRDFGLCWHSDGRVVAGTGAPETFVASPPGHHDGEWHHVAFSRDRPTGRIALYVDGVLVDEAVGTTEPLDAPPRLVVGGLQPGGHGFHGDLDELCIYERALDAAEVLAQALDLRAGIGSAGGPRTRPALVHGTGLRPPMLETIDVLCATEPGAEAPPGYVRVRGDVHSRGDRVEPAFPEVLGAGPPRIEAVVGPDGRPRSSGRRLALARWITDPTNPLTWRVLANRLVQHHFGRGLCRTPNDFGRLGELPTHPQLLDWLACEVTARGGSLKAMHRLLVTSGSYRMACDVDADRRQRDPQNDWFWRFPRRRLQAEEVRDSMLAAAGLLDLRLGGASVYPPLPAAVLATSSRPDEAWGESSAEDAARRSLYVHLKRSLLEPVLAAFDLADTDASCPVRFATVQPTQALTLMNGEFAHAMASAFAARLDREAPDLHARIERGLWLCASRPPRPGEVERLLRLCDDLQQRHGRTEAEALQRCCLLLLNSNEFLYLD